LCFDFLTEIKLIPVQVLASPMSLFPAGNQQLEDDPFIYLYKPDHSPNSCLYGSAAVISPADVQDSHAMFGALGQSMHQGTWRMRTPLALVLHMQDGMKMERHDAGVTGWVSPAAAYALCTWPAGL
jgi:hypothetical protein